MTTLPEWALSIRQPWAAAVIHLGKPLENRTWRRPNPGLEFRGRVAIHASRGLTRYEYEDAAEFMAKLGATCPAAIDLKRGGIIGSVTVVDVVKSHPSPWFFGPIALVLRDPEPCEFVPAMGELGFFRWKPSEEGSYVEPARWMLPKHQLDLAEPAEPQFAFNDAGEAI